MYDNIGGKIKGLAKAIFIVEAVVAIFAGIMLWNEYEEWWCLVILFCSPIVAWIFSWLLYGFGELIDKTCAIERNTRGGERKSEAQSKVDTDTEHNVQ